VPRLRVDFFLCSRRRKPATYFTTLVIDHFLAALQLFVVISSNSNMRRRGPVLGICWMLLMGLFGAPPAALGQAPSAYENGAYGYAVSGNESPQQDQPGRLSQPVAIEARPLSEVNTRSPEAVLKPFPFRQATAMEALPTDVKGDDSRPPLKLSPRGQTSGRSLSTSSPATPASAIGTVASSLAIVICLLLVVAWVSRRFAPPGAAPLPPQAIELLGRQPLGGKQALQLLRVGNKLLLVALSPGGAQTLTEITDPVEVEHLAGLCRRTKSDSASAAFSRVLSQLATEPASDVPRTTAVHPNARGAA
jgi:flagellar protein FliO/FliZ